MSQERWLVAVGAGRWQMPGIRAARAAGLKVLAVDGLADAPGLTLADKSLIVDIRDIGAVVEAVAGSDVTPAGAIAFCNEAGMLTSAALRERFHLPGVLTEVVTGLTNKGVQRKAWTETGLPCPAWFVVTSSEEVPAALGEIRGKSIFKPVDSAGSRGVTVVEQGAPWEAAFQAAFQGSPSRQVIIEAFIEGLEHTVETFTHRGVTHVLAVTSKKKVAGTGNTVASELASAQLSEAMRKEAGDICSRALAALGYQDGPGHTELLLTAGGEFFLVETAGRGGGFMVADGIVPNVSGFDMATASSLQAVGIEPSVPPKAKPRAIVLRFVPSHQGTVSSIDGFAPEHEIPGVQSEPLVALGQVVGRAASDGDRMAFILAVADNLDEALALADKKQRLIKITVR